MPDNKQAPYSDFGARLAALRKDANMSRAELGEICGVAPSTIVNYERGLRIPYADTAVKMADFFQISIHELLGVDDPESEMLAAQPGHRKAFGTLPLFLGQAVCHRETVKDISSPCSALCLTLHWKPPILTLLTPSAARTGKSVRRSAMQMLRPDGSSLKKPLKK